MAGRWRDDCGFLDGEKLLCMDSFYKALEEKNCLVYSFGLADDWDFEILMAELGEKIQIMNVSILKLKFVFISFSRLLPLDEFFYSCVPN